MRNALRGTALALACLLTLAANASEKPRRSTIEIVERLLAADRQVPPGYRPDPEAPQRVERQFAFDDLLSLEPETLMQGVQYVIVKYARPDDPAQYEAYARQMNERLQALFEYYPLLARTPKDFDLLLGAINDGTQPPVLRAFLIRRCAPGLAGRSALGDYMQGMLAESDRLGGALSKIIENPTESTEVQEVAVDALGASIDASYAALLAADPMVRDALQKGEPQPRVQQLKVSPDAIPLARRTRLQIEQKNTEVGRVAEMLWALSQDPNRTLSLRRKAEAAVAVIVRDYPIPNEATVREKNRQQPPPR